MMRTDGKVIELEEVVSKLRCDIIGLSEVRREGEDSIILESGNWFYYREGDQQSQDGVGFIVHKSLVNNIVKVESVSSIPYTQNYQTVFVEGHTGIRASYTSAHPDEDVRRMPRTPTTIL
ncbi:jg9739 [Pararge aegeria aegeria]|uniref:Jg9739 protein n=1 Tax=Pararge aegeria aegeria TaxID=348720 RepID=A0A8S4QXD8_9NEOP|nr:jg9739 [Pararge aegeria aegeria]